MLTIAAANRTTSFFTATRPLPAPRPRRRQHHRLKPLSAHSLPSPPPPSPTPYQPFRPPPPSSASSLTLDAIITTLANRLGLWFDYAPFIPLLFQQGFSPSSIEEVTGISGVEQNRLVVASKVRDSLLPSFDPEVLAFFDAGGAELLYELRLLNNAQRAAAARRLVGRGLDARAAQEMARAMKDFPRRRGDHGWDDFDRDSPGDCVAFAHLRQSREDARSPAAEQAWLERAAAEAETDAARARVAAELRRLVSGGDGAEGPGEPAAKGVAVPVVRMRLGEVAEASSVAVLPVCESAAEVAGAPECRAGGDFGVVAAEEKWGRFVVLPGWEPVLSASPARVAVAFPDARALPWRNNRWRKEEAVLVVVDRAERAVEGEDSFYLVGGEGGSSLEVERGVRLKEKGVEEAVGIVVLVVRPPKEEDDDRIADEDWE